MTRRAAAPYFSFTASFSSMTPSYSGMLPGEAGERHFPKMRSVSSAQTAELSAVALGRLALPQCLEMRHRCALLGGLFPCFEARFCFGVKSLRHDRRAAHLAHAQHFYLEFTGIVLDPQPVSGMHLTRRLHQLRPALDSAEFASFRS